MADGDFHLASLRVPVVPGTSQVRPAMEEAGPGSADPTPWLLDHYGITPVRSVGRSVGTSAARFASMSPKSALRSALIVGVRVVNSVVSDAGPLAMADMR